MRTRGEVNKKLSRTRSAAYFVTKDRQELILTRKWAVSAELPAHSL